jgi:methionine-rich copper-binding protein CopC
VLAEGASLFRPTVLLALIAGVLLVPGMAWAHAMLEGAVPPVGGTVAVAPGELHLHFSEGVEPRFTKVAVATAAGAEVPVGPFHVDPADNKELLVPLPKLGAGTYTVTWRAVAVDTHRSRGSYRFTVAP